MEVLDTRKASPRLLDLPRKNPKLLEPVLNDGKPVVIRAEMRTDQGATLSISNGQANRLVAYIPVRVDNEILGIMLLEKFGGEEDTEKLLEMLGYYLNHTALALKSALNAKNLEDQREQLIQTISNMDSHIGLLTEIIQFEPRKEEFPFQGFLSRVGKAHGASDGVLIRFHSDGSSQCLARLEVNRDKTMQGIEEQVMKALQSNPTRKASVKTHDGSILSAWPLKQGSRLVGILFLHIPEKERQTLGVLDVCARMIEEHLALYVLREEKELWENFYQNTLQV